MEMGDGATLARTDELTREFRGEMGIGRPEVFGRNTMAMEAGGGPRSGTSRGLELADVDQLLREHEERSYQVGYSTGSDHMFHQAQAHHQVELGQYVGGAFSLVESEVLAAIVGAAAKARDRKGSTKADIVQAVVDQVKREAASLNEMAHRARTGELFS